MSNPAGANWLTSFTYDARNNLTNVNQGGRDRSFVYDSLSRLASANSPETGPSYSENGFDQNGSYFYGYDLAGNLLSRTDPNNASVTWLYDVLSRPVSKTYNDGLTSTVAYCYDGATSAACAAAPVDDSTKYLKGRLTLVTNGVSSTSYSQYDALGRATKSSQKFADFPTRYDFAYGYNFLGLTSITYPSTRQVAYGYDTAGRINSAGSYITAVGYADNGAISQMAMAGGRYEVTCLNTRLQPSTILLRTAAPGTSNCADTANNLAKLTFDYGSLTSGADGSSSNNGNLMNQTIADGASWLASQSYGYDKFNRLSYATEGSWRMTFGYDSWGNRWVDPANTNTYGLSLDPNTPRRRPHTQRRH